MNQGIFTCLSVSHRVIACGGPNSILLLDKQFYELFSEPIKCGRIAVSNDYVVMEGMKVLSLMENSIKPIRLSASYENCLAMKSTPPLLFAVQHQENGLYLTQIDHSPILLLP